jgi:hypothetical protein
VVVLYWEATGDDDAVVADIAAVDGVAEAVAVTEDGFDA